MTRKGSRTTLVVGHFALTSHSKATFMPIDYSPDALADGSAAQFKQGAYVIATAPRTNPKIALA